MAPTFVPEATVAEFAPLHEQGAFLVDVREPYEYREGHVPGAISIPMGELEERLAEIPADKEVYVICAAGHRSYQGAEFLIEKGRHATSIAGGTTGWKRAGHPVEQ